MQLVRYQEGEGRHERGHHSKEEPVSHEVEKHVNEAAHEGDWDTQSSSRS